MLGKVHDSFLQVCYLIPQIFSLFCFFVNFLFDYRNYVLLLLLLNCVCNGLLRDFLIVNIHWRTAHLGPSVEGIEDVGALCNCLWSFRALTWNRDGIQYLLFSRSWLQSGILPMDTRRSLQLLIFLPEKFLFAICISGGVWSKIVGIFLLLSLIKNVILFV